MTDWISKVITGPANSQDLTTLAIAKAELKLTTDDTSNDVWLASTISQESQIIAEYCSRFFWPQRYTETQQIEQDPYPYQTPGGVQPLQLSEWPLIQVNSVNQVYPINTNQTMVVGTDYSVDTRKGSLQRLNPFTGVAAIWEAVPTVIDYVAGYGAMANETWTVPATPFQITPAQAATFSFIESITYQSSGVALTPIASGTPAAGQYLLTAGTGTAVLTFAAADTGQVLLGSYAYAVIPAALVRVALRMITLRWFDRGRDPMLMSQDQPGLGSQRWWIPQGGAKSTQNGGIPPEVTDILAPYRVPVIA